MDDQKDVGWVKLFHVTGAQVTFPVSLAGVITPQMAANVSDSLDNLLMGGFSVSAPGLDRGENVEEVVSVSRRMNSDGTVPVVAFFVAHPKMLKKFIHAYLDTPEDVAAFEAGTGLRLDQIPIWESDKDPEKSNPKADRYIVPLPRPVNIVWKMSPKWEAWKAEGGNGNEPQKRLLERYAVAHPAPGSKIERPEETRVRADPVTGEIYENDNLPPPAVYNKMSAQVVDALAKTTNLKPGVIAQILAKHPGKTITMSEALDLIETSDLTTKGA